VFPIPDSDRTLDHPWLDRLSGSEVRPVFIIAPHRSGTTLLYRILAETGCFNVVSVHHILNRHRLLALHFTGQDQAAREQLNCFFDSRGIRGESMNSREFNADVLEEYCYAFEHQGRRPRLAPANAEDFKLFCGKLQTIQNPSRPLLLKNPYDGIGFLYIRQVFPQARFIFIYRNPVDVINSRIRLNRLLLSRKFEYHAQIVQDYARLFESPVKLAIARFLFSERLPLMTELVCRDVSLNCDYVREHVDELGAAAFGVTYPDLCADPTSVIRQIMQFLGLEDREGQEYSNMIGKRDPNMLPELEHRRQRILRRNEAYCRKFHV
jgi:LPS sulfotransferase NodH